MIGPVRTRGVWRLLASGAAAAAAARSCVRGALDEGAPPSSPWAPPPCLPPPTPSRRTGAENEAVLRKALQGSGAVIWDGTGGNPYFGYLAHADQIVATCDSVSMVSEACATGKPVYVYDLPGGSAKFRRFHEKLRDDGITRPFTGAVIDWSYEPFDETARVGQEIRCRMTRAGADR